jgi:hypothetical protein
MAEPSSITKHVVSQRQDYVEQVFLWVGLHQPSYCLSRDYCSACVICWIWGSPSGDYEEYRLLVAMPCASWRCNPEYRTLQATYIAFRSIHSPAVWIRSSLKPSHKTREPLNGLSWNSIVETFTTVYQLVPFKLKSDENNGHLHQDIDKFLRVG